MLVAPDCRLRHLLVLHHVALEAGLTMVVGPATFAGNRESLLRDFGCCHIAAEVREDCLLHRGFEAGRLKGVVSWSTPVTVVQRPHVVLSLLTGLHVLHRHEAIDGIVGDRCIECAERICLVK